MRAAIIWVCMLLGVGGSAAAEVSIGINIGGYPDLVAVAGYPVYYAPQLGANLFFYDGLYWVYAQDRWYASSWYNGPWDLVSPEAMPLFVLRVPVRYYREPPSYFRGWGPEAPPRWGEHWGADWDQHHSGWDRWDRGSEPPPAPLPNYQRQYSGDRYPRGDEQQALRTENYHYQPREAVARQQYEQPAGKPAPVQQQPARNQPTAAPTADARRGNAPVAAATGHPKPRPASAEPVVLAEAHPPSTEHEAVAPDTHRSNVSPAAAHSAATRQPESRPPSTHPVLAEAPPASSSEHGASPQQGQPAVERQQAQPEHASPPREPQPSPAREHNQPPQAQEPNRTPERDRQQ
jgi:hypothetical protein